MQRQLREMLGRERDRIDKVWLVTDDAPLSPALRAALEAAVPVTRAACRPRPLARWLAAGARARRSKTTLHRRPDGRVDDAHAGQGRPDAIKRDLERLLRASAFWDTPGRQP